MHKLIEAVKLSEGFRDKVYKCTEGYDTIGYGFAVKDLVLDEDIAEGFIKNFHLLKTCLKKHKKLFMKCAIS